MDGLSLLCNLHADGPLALRRFRSAGVNDLGDLQGLPESTLSACLRSSAGHGRRFLEEARQLALRLAESPLEREPWGEEGEEGVHVPQPARRPGEAPLFAWCADPRVDAARVGGAPGVLPPGIIAGLDERTCERLAAQGVRTLETLHERASLALARSAGIPFAKLLDLAAQARLALSPHSPELRSLEVAPEAPRHPPALAGRSVVFAPAVIPAARARQVQASDPGVSGPFG